MTPTFLACWAAILAFDGVLLYALGWMAEHPRFAAWRIRRPDTPQIPLLRKTINTALNHTLALLMFIGFLYYAGERSLYAGWPGAATFLGEVLGVLLLYDLMYYFFHRGMHIRGVMRYCHVVHHRVRFTTATDSVFLHPLEMIGGVSLLIVSLLVLGPISQASFLAMFFIYSTVNIIVHCNLVVPHPAFRLFNFWVQKHDVHHHRARNNYASIFPFWDQAFGTLE